MDDGHQNPQVKKTLSLLVVDAEIGFGNGAVFPAGPLRERLSRALGRADAIILMKPTREFEISDELSETLKGHIIIPATFHSEQNLPKTKLFAFAGIGRPNKFFDSLRRAGADIVEEIPYADHYRYKPEDMQQLNELAAEYGADLITTEKDHVRIPKPYNASVHTWPVTVEFEDELTLRRLLHPIIEQAKAAQASHAK